MELLAPAFPVRRDRTRRARALGQRRNITDRDQDTSAAAVEDLAWSGVPRVALEALVAQHDLAGTVEILGQRSQSEVGMLMRDAEVLVFPSIRELGAGVVVEALRPASKTSPRCGARREVRLRPPRLAKRGEGQG